MSVTVGSARIDENGHAYNGKAGDQTGKEVSTQAYYVHSKGWRVLRANNPAVQKKLAECMEMACANNHIGYDQYQRNTLYKAAEDFDFDVSKVKTNVETDCSALVRVCCAYAGIKGLPSSMRTTNMCELMLATGEFKELKESKYTTGSAYLKAGDVLCTKTQGHTVIVLTNGSKAEPDVYVEPTKRILERGDNGADVKALQEALLVWNPSCLPVYGADGDFGSETLIALKAFQKDRGLVVDGIAGEDTFEAIAYYQTNKAIVITGGTVNVREGAGVGYAIIKTVKQGQKFTFTASVDVGTTKWYRIPDGYVSGKYAEVVK